MSAIRFKKIFKYNLVYNLSALPCFVLKHGNFGIRNIRAGLVKYKHLERVRRRISKQFKRLELKRFRLYLTIKL